MEAAEQEAQSPFAGQRIVVAGAGIAGLAFCRALDRAWPETMAKPHVVLYERREKAVSREREGYNMSIRSDPMSGGMQALRSLGLLDEVLNAGIAGKTSGTFLIWDNNWTPLLTMGKGPPDGLPVSSVRITRYALRQILIDVLPDTVETHWATGCTSASLSENGRVQITLTDGSTDHCDLLIAADGARSMIRAALRPADGLNFAGVVKISASSKFPNGPPHPVDKNYGLAIGGDGSSLFASPIDDHTALWSVGILSEEPQEPLRGDEVLKRKDEILKEARHRGKSFAEPFQQLVDATDPATLMVFNSMDKYPKDHSEMPNLPVVFIGDSNHAVSPFAGNGANMALMDGIDIAEELCSTKDVRSIISAFDGKSRARSKRTVDASHWMIRMAHSTGWRLWLWKGLLRVVNLIVSFRA